MTGRAPDGGNPGKAALRREFPTGTGLAEAGLSTAPMGRPAVSCYGEDAVARDQIRRADIRDDRRRAVGGRPPRRSKSSVPESRPRLSFRTAARRIVGAISDTSFRSSCDPESYLIMKRLLDSRCAPRLARGCAVLGARRRRRLRTGLLQALQAIEDTARFRGLTSTNCRTTRDHAVRRRSARRPSASRRSRTATRAAAPRPGGGADRAPVAALMAGDRRLEWPGADRLGGADRAAGRRCRRHGPRLPEILQVTMHLAGISPSPAVLTDERGNLLFPRRSRATGWSGWSGRPPWSSAGRPRRRSTSLTVGAGAGRDGAELGVAGDGIGEAVGGREGSPVAALHGGDRRLPAVDRKVWTSSGGRPAVRPRLRADRGPRRRRRPVLRLEMQNENLVALERGGCSPRCRT